MRKYHEAALAVEVYSPAEEQFNRRRRTIGLALGPILFLTLLVAPLPLAPPAHRLGAILAMMIVLWVTEALPLAVTALIGPILVILLGIAPARDAFAPFADPIIFLFIGSFMLAEAMFVHGLDRRIAYSALAWPAVSGSPWRILVTFGGVTTFISMWISNTATTAMMFPIGLSIVAHVAKNRMHDPAIRRFAMAMMLITAFGATIGGMATPIGTPPNLIGLGMLERLTGYRLSFAGWILFGLPLTIVMFFVLAGFFGATALKGVELDKSATNPIREELRTLGQLKAGERNVLIAFAITVALWLLPGVLAITGQGDSAFARGYAAVVPESVAAMIGAILLFLLPVNWRARRFTLAWDDASRIDWGIILLFGGGLMMGELAFSTGLAERVGRGILTVLPANGPIALTLLFTGLAAAVSETASNTASANMIIPIAIAVAQASGVDPVVPALGATLGSSLGFMMPISSPPNAIVYSSGHVPIGAMMRYGIALDIAGFIIVTAMLLAFGRLLV
jgi:sodium-dependent dicarboxylate transporter 2/3/5